MGLRIYRCGKIERKFKSKGWKEVKNTANDSKGYTKIDINGKRWYRHRLVVAAFNKNFDINNTEHHIDHIDHDKLNNAFSNLRVVTNQHNHFNRPAAKGYFWNKQKGKWQAQIAVNNKKKHLGLFDIWEEARAAYLAAKDVHHVIDEIC